jgi:hypothetical protein
VHTPNKTVSGFFFQVMCSVFIFLNGLAKCMSIILYSACCECLKYEFKAVNQEIKTCVLTAVAFRSIALRHSRLLKCLAFLKNMMSMYAFLMFAGSIVFSIIFAYVIVLEVDTGFRIIAALWLISSFSINAVLCISADSLRNTVSFFSFEISAINCLILQAKEAKDRICARIAEENHEKELDLSVNFQYYSAFVVKDGY